MAEQTAYIPVDLMHRFMVDVFHKMGVPRQEAEIIAEILITSDLRGIESHGVGRLRMYYDRIKQGRILAQTKLTIVKETETTAVLDGGFGMGHVVAHRAMEMALDKAKAFGMGAVAVRNSTHFGIAGYYPLMAIKRDMIGLTVTNARPSIAPTFGVEPMLGTNPIAFGCPTDEACPFLFDGATSITQRGKIEVLDRAEKPTPAGWIIDQEGKSVTDSAAILDGLTKSTNALLPLGGFGDHMGGHKGYGLATVVELLSAALQDGKYLRAITGFDENGKPTFLGVGHFFLAMDIEHFVPVATFKRVAGSILRDLRGSVKAPGHDRIYTANEKEWEMERVVRAQGIPANANLQKDVAYVRADLGLTNYEFPF